MSMSNVITTISLDDANRLDKRLGAWIWDGLLFQRDSIVDPQLLILPNEAGTRLRRFLAEMAQENWRDDNVPGHRDAKRRFERVAERKAAQ